jgi:hypothetical protein
MILLRDRRRAFRKVKIAANAEIWQIFSWQIISHLPASKATGNKIGLSIYSALKLRSHFKNSRSKPKN